MRMKWLSESVLGKLVRPGVYAVRLPSYVRFFESKIDELSRVTDKQAEQAEKLQTETNKLIRQMDKLAQVQHAIGEKVNELHRPIEYSSGPTSKSGHVPKGINNTMADDHAHDKFYKDFEDRFRGSEELIQKRLQEYKPYLQGLPAVAQKLPVLDLGCGRGEFLKVAEESGLKAVGVDMNMSMVERAKSQGFKAFEDDALSYLVKQKASAFSVISGFHLVEHIPFPSLLKIFAECYRIVHKDGFVLFETPNPNNLTVGASNFYMDPSHIKPIPPKLLAFTLETQGFFTEIIELHPARTEIRHDDPVIEDVMRMLYGPVDYAVIASKQPLKSSVK